MLPQSTYVMGFYSFHENEYPSYNCIDDGCVLCQIKEPRWVSLTNYVLGIFLKKVNNHFATIFQFTQWCQNGRFCVWERLFENCCIVFQIWVIFVPKHPINTRPALVQIMMTSSNGTIFRVTGPLCCQFTGHRWIPHTKASDAELWCELWSAPE